MIQKKRRTLKTLFLEYIFEQEMFYLPESLIYLRSIDCNVDKQALKLILVWRKKVLRKQFEKNDRFSHTPIYDL